MSKTLVEKILAAHSSEDQVTPGKIIDVSIDVRCARDFGGANVVKNLQDNGLTIDDVDKTFFTFDCNPSGSDQKYAVNQHLCRKFAREKGIKIYDINKGIGTHLAIEDGLAIPGSTFVSTDSHANIMGAVGAFGQGMGDRDIAAVFANGSVWFKVPKSAKINIVGKKPKNISAKDIVLNLLNKFGANTLLGYSVEFYGEAVNDLSLDERITIASMGTEMGAIILLFPPSQAVLEYFREKTGKTIAKIEADADAHYDLTHEINIEEFVPMTARPGSPADTIAVNNIIRDQVKIDSVFIGSCTNGRIEDLRIAANILKNKKVAPGLVLKIVPATDDVWIQAQNEGLIKVFKNAGAMVSNAGCAGCAAGQVGQNGLGEVVVSTGNRNFPGKQGKGEVYLASVATAAASAVSGYVTSEDQIAQTPAVFTPSAPNTDTVELEDDVTVSGSPVDIPMKVSGRVWIIDEDDIDTDMIFHNRYLTITDIAEMGQYTFDNLSGYEDFSKKVEKNDIIITRKNFGAGSSRQQAVDCFKALGVCLILAESFGAIYERNAINSGFPILTYSDLSSLEIVNGDVISVDLTTGLVVNKKNGKEMKIDGFSNVQTSIFQRGGLLKPVED